MVAVMYLKSVVGTVKETRFISTALNIIEGDVSRAMSIAATRVSALSIPVPHAPTKNLCVIHVPFIITHGSPELRCETPPHDPPGTKLPPTSFVSGSEYKKRKKLFHII